MSESYKGGKLYFLSWTTTPWSLAANRAIAFKDDAEYVIVQLEQDFYIVSGVLLSSNSELQEIFSSEPKIIETLSGTELSHFKYSHPLSPRTRLPLLPGSHVTLDAGTGLVHTAPAHGPEDYLLGIKHELDLSCSVNEQGKYDVTVSATIHPDLEGLEVLSDGNQAIIKMLDDGGHLLKKTDFEHSYPYDWRTKKPVILRASRQWFMDTRSLQSRALELVSSKVSIAPSSMTPGFEGVLKTRPYWCISRQRVWGVPIPVFYDENEQAVTSAELIEKLCELTEKHGNVDFWWSMPKHELLKTLGFSTTTNLSKG
jgi:isoleucyl-tRNA synthetase